jgi:DNA polymerase I-like protein with 3'-5' exonuclease and polymerase domains
MASALRTVHKDIPQNVSAKGKLSPSITKEWLWEKGRTCEVARAISRARKVNKVRTTFAASVRTHAVRGRVHCTFNQLRKSSDDGSGGSESGETEGAAFGRLSCVDPNLQQQPARDPELGPMWRAVYVPDDGKIWCANDYSQQEPRWAVSYAERLTAEMYSCGGALCTLEQGRKTLEAAHRAAEAYRNDPSTDNHQMMADMAGIKRKDAKEIYLGLTYGMGGAKLSRKLGLPTKWIDTKRRGKVEVAGDEGAVLLALFDEKVPFLKLLAKRLERDAGRRGWIQTEGGRKCHFPRNHEDTGYDWAHKALNRLIQGVSGDQTKTALVELDAAGYYIQLQVHDEIDGSVENAEEANAMAGVMVRALPSTVPSKVDTELGSSWGASMGWTGKFPS